MALRDLQAGCGATRQSAAKLNLRQSNPQWTGHGSAWTLNAADCLSE